MPAPTQIYKETAKIVANPREVEANLLFQSASRLQAIADHWDGKAAELRDALLYNRRLWTIFVASVTSDANPLPEDIRRNVTHLGLYVLRRTLLILADPRPGSLAVLIGINRNLASGLLSLPESAH
ncbi:MAG: flagellar biosynthesis regulator FlaF [Pseudolabrys sp.]